LTSETIANTGASTVVLTTQYDGLETRRSVLKVTIAGTADLQDAHTYDAGK
jgi:hypothetical protein